MFRSIYQLPVSPAIMFTPSAFCLISAVGFFVLFIFLNQIIFGIRKSNTGARLAGALSSEAKSCAGRVIGRLIGCRSRGRAEGGGGGLVIVTAVLLPALAFSLAHLPSQPSTQPPSRILFWLLLPSSPSILTNPPGRSNALPSTRPVFLNERTRRFCVPLRSLPNFGFTPYPLFVVVLIAFFVFLDFFPPQRPPFLFSRVPSAFSSFAGSPLLKVLLLVWR